MKKILLVFDGSNYSEGVLRFVEEMHKKEPVYIAAAFVPLIDYSAIWSRSASESKGFLSAVLLEDGDTITVKANMDRFRKFCEDNKISYNIHEDFYDFAIPELKKESRFADLLVIGSERFYEKANHESNMMYLEEALHDVE
jgi:hypothetical protein